MGVGGDKQHQVDNKSRSVLERSAVPSTTTRRGPRRARTVVPPRPRPRQDVLHHVTNEHTEAQGGYEELIEDT